MPISGIPAAGAETRSPLAGGGPAVGGVSVTIELTSNGSTAKDTGKPHGFRRGQFAISGPEIPSDGSRRSLPVHNTEPSQSDNGHSSCCSCCMGGVALIGVLVLASAIGGMLFAGSKAANSNASLPPPGPRSLAPNLTPAPTSASPVSLPEPSRVEGVDGDDSAANTEPEATAIPANRDAISARQEAAGLQALASLRAEPHVPSTWALKVVSAVLLRLAGRGSGRLDTAVLDAVRDLPALACPAAPLPPPPATNGSALARSLPGGPQLPASARAEADPLCGHGGMAQLAGAWTQPLTAATTTAAPELAPARTARVRWRSPPEQRLAYSPDGAHLAFAAPGGVQVWSLTPEGAVQSAEGELHALPSSADAAWLSWSPPSPGAPAGAGLAMGASDGGVYLVWVGPGGRWWPWQVAENGAAGAWSLAGGHLAIARVQGSAGPAVEVVQASQLFPYRRLHLEYTSAAGVRALAWGPSSPGRMQLAAATDDGRLALWRLPVELAAGVAVLRDSDHAQYLRGHLGALQLLAWSPSGQLCGGGGGDGGGAWLWADVEGEHPEEAQALVETSGRMLQSVTSLQWSAFSGRLAAGDATGHVHIWQPTAGPVAAQDLEGPAVPVRSVAWDPTGSLLAGAGVGGVSVWHPALGGNGLADAPEMLSSGATALAWAPGGARLATAAAPRGSGPGVQLWEMGVGRAQELFQQLSAGMDLSLTAEIVTSMRLPEAILQP